MSGPSEDLLRRAAVGDAQAMDELLRLHEPSLLAFVRVNAGPALRACESVRDILQDILLEVAQGLAKIEYRGEAEFRGWLYTLAERRVRDRARHFRRAKRDSGRVEPLRSDADLEAMLVEGYSALGGPARDLERREALAKLESAFESLPANDRQVLTLSVFCGMNSAQIAEQLGLDPEVVRKRRTRARTRLAGLLGDIDA